MKLLVLASLFACLTVGFSSPTGSEPCTKSVTYVRGKGQACAKAIIFEDNFDTLDLDTWQHEITAGGGGNWEFQIYTNNRSNSYVRDGILYIRPTLTADKYGEAFLSSGRLSLWGGSPADDCTNNADYGCERIGNPTNVLNPVMSARLRTLNSFSFTYGRIDVRARLPAGDWLWPAIWMLPRQNVYGPWPASGELDIMEGRGNKQLTVNGVNIGAEQVASTLHFGPDGPFNSWDRTHFEKNSPPGQGYDLDFHVYSLNWTPDFMTFYVDDEEIGTMTPPAGGFWEMGDFANRFPGVENPWRTASKMAPYDQDFYIVLNVASGGIAYFPDGADNPSGQKPWNNLSPTASSDFWNAKNTWYPTWNAGVNNGEGAAMAVDYVRVTSL